MAAENRFVVFLLTSFNGIEGILKQLFTSVSAISVNIHLDFVSVNIHR